MGRLARTDSLSQVGGEVSRSEVSSRVSESNCTKASSLPCLPRWNSGVAMGSGKSVFLGEDLVLFP